MWGSYSWAASFWASHPTFGTTRPGFVFGDDSTVMRAYGSDMGSADTVFGGAEPGAGVVYGGDGVHGAGYAYGGDAGDKAFGDDERAG